MVAERDEVARLTEQLEQWRASGGHPAAWAACQITTTNATTDEVPGEGRREAERRRWREEVERLRRALEDARQRSHGLALESGTFSATAAVTAAASGRTPAAPVRSLGASTEGAAGTCLAGGGRGHPETDQLLEELATERLATAAARERAGALRGEAAEERRSLARRRASEELASIGSRMRAERGLRLAQQAELADADRAAEELRVQLVAARTANAELRTALATQQELLQRLRG